jgi:glycosyltransferase involved in cell wall biosynthesis
VFTYAESSPFQFAVAKLSLNLVDLIVPSSTTAARHICQRFGIPSRKVQAVSWGVDRQTFKRTDGDERKQLRRKWGIEPEALVFLNVRRFRPIWGGFVALEAFMRIANEHPSSHFILLAGQSTEEFIRQARERLQEAGLLSRFILLDGHAPLEVCAELMSISDVFTSLLGRGDMRSASVLQAAAAGGLPVVSDTPEYREMERLGFAGLFVRPDSVEDVLGALRFVVRNPESVSEIAARNQIYIAEHEEHFKQMNRMLSLIDDVCTDYETRKR